MKTPSIIHEDNQILVLNKPAGLAVHAAPSLAPGEHTIVTYVLKHDPAIQKIGEDPNRPGIVHRLDRDTSGVLIVAKTNAAFASLKKQFQDRTIQKQYLLLVHGVPSWETQTVDLMISRKSSGSYGARHTNDVATMRSTDAATYREAKTIFTVEQRGKGYTLMNAQPKTGRTHQIRVHAKAMGFPIAGDALYAGRKNAALAKKQLGLTRQFLHAALITFTNPANNQSATFSAPLPQDLKTALEHIDD